jgi:maleate isomerase
MSGADGVVLSCCVQMPSLPAIPAAEEALGLPVLSAATATVYDLLTTLGRSPVVPDAGSLLSGERPGVVAGLMRGRRAG